MIAFLLALLLLPAAPAAGGSALHVRWHPTVVRPGDVALVFLPRLPDASVVEGSVGQHPLSFFLYGEGYAALVGVDLETKPGRLRWRVGAVNSGGVALRASGTIRVRGREYPVQRLTLPRAMVELDAASLARVEEESKRLRTLYATITPERLWRGRFTRPVSGAEDGTGFGARRIINGLPRSPHAGLDYSAEAGTPVVAANRGRVALVGEMFFPGRLVVIDHGLGLFTLYFHLERADVQEGEPVERGHVIGAVGATGRATGPHLHFAVHLRRARVDPSVLLDLPVSD